MEHLRLLCLSAQDGVVLKALVTPIIIREQAKCNIQLCFVPRFSLQPTMVSFRHIGEPKWPNLRRDILGFLGATWMDASRYGLPGNLFFYLVSLPTSKNATHTLFLRRNPVETLFSFPPHTFTAFVLPVRHHCTVFHLHIYFGYAEVFGGCSCIHGMKMHAIARGGGVRQKTCCCGTTQTFGSNDRGTLPARSRGSRACRSHSRS